MKAHQHSLAHLARHIRTSREDILAAWRKAVREDVMLTTAQSLPRRQLDDHVPGLLQDFASRLDPEQQTLQSEIDEQSEQAVAHAAHRWQQGYDLQEVSRELGRLNEAVVAELEKYARQHSEMEPRRMADARLAWAEMIGVESSKSIAEYFRLQQLEAAGHLKDLEQALDAVRELEQQRAELWHQAAHDLRGNLGVVMTATAGLKRAGTTPVVQEQFARILDRNVASLHQLLDDVLDFSRLQAGKERRRAGELDVGVTLGELVDSFQGDAQSRGIFLRHEGPAAFVVEGDSVKVRRLVQNLVVNAIKYTRHGGVTVSWGDSVAEDAKRWMLAVKDTGPGFPAAPTTSLAAALKQVTAEAGILNGEVQGMQETGEADHPVASTRELVREGRGEGIGLSIVKRLAELLDATVEVQSDAAGTTFRVFLPRCYSDPVTP